VAELDWTVTLGYKFYRPWLSILTPGNTAVCTVEPARVSLLDGIELLGDKAYTASGG
jgi:hypothetical protein